MKKSYREIDELAEKYGFEFDRPTGSGHFRYVHPNGAVVVASRNASDFRDLKNLEAEFKRGAASN